MDGIRTLLVALLLICAPIGGVVVADPAGDTPDSQQSTEDSERLMTVFTAGNTSEYLAPSPDRIDRTDERSTGLDVSAAVEADAGTIESTYLATTLERRYVNAESDAERRAIVREGTDLLSSHVDGLTAAEQTAVRRYSNGAIGTRELLRTIAVVSREADVTVDSLEWMQTTATELGMDAEAKQAATEQVRLVPLRGPVRTGLAESTTGDRALRVHVETIDSGIVLAAIDRRSGTYLREAHDPTAKTNVIGDQYEGNPSPALDRFTELYPWTINSFDGIDAIGPEQVRLYRFSATHSHGELETYLDSGSTDIIHERQRIDPNSAPTTVIERTQDQRKFVLNRTRAGGPLGISMLDAEDGTPIAAEIEVNGDPVGTTGNARLWTVAPRGPTTINATHAGETISIETTFS